MSPGRDPRPPTIGGLSAELRNLWDSGDALSALRAVFENWDALLGEGDLAWLEPVLRKYGLPAEACAVQVQRARRVGNPQAWAAVLRSILQSGDPWWVAELLTEGSHASRELAALRVEVALAIGDAADVIRDWEREYTDAQAREAALAWWVRAGHIEDVERLLQEHRADEPDGVVLWRARIALWHGRPDQARTILARLSPSPEVRCLTAIATVQSGHLDEGEAQLRELVENDRVRGDALGWLATVLRKQGRYHEAVQAANGASMASEQFNLVTRLERDLASAALDVSKTDRVLRAIGLQRGGMSRQVDARSIRELEHAPLLAQLGVSLDDALRALEHVIARFGGNHTPHLTIIEDGRLRSVPLPRDPRHLGATVQRVLWTRGADAARALYRTLAPSVDHHPLFRIYEGELELWMGAYATAARIFEEVLVTDRRTRWAWIGLGAAAMLQGDLSEAQAIWARGLRLTKFAGPTLYVYRGECHRRQGEPGRARADLHTALRDKPQRRSARLNLALVEGTADALERAEQEASAFAPLLMATLQGSAAEKLEQVLEAMRGNRSSSDAFGCYQLWGRTWRFATAR